uniref:alpha-N-acetylgalactosaminide alpha-2,6-sialyltransferase n=1 Tax=Neogobius melanostomus TaxID=47308 RepID=A0A8C6UF18_9GOBI
MTSLVLLTLSLSEVVPAINLVSKPKYPLLSPKPGRDCISCAVVATGGVLWKSRKGREIDNHDYVFRCVNGAVIKGFEEDVGSRTDVYVHTAFSITAPVFVSLGIKYVLIPEGKRDFEWLTGLYKRERLSDTLPSSLIHRFLNSSTLNLGFWPIVRPTNGAFMMFVALHVCDRVDAYGFISDDHRKYSNYYYERGANTHVTFFGNHNYNMEKDLWKIFHELKIINLYSGESDPTEPTAPKQNRRR